MTLAGANVQISGSETEDVEPVPAGHIANVGRNGPTALNSTQDGGGLRTPIDFMREVKVGGWTPMNSADPLHVDWWIQIISTADQHTQRDSPCAQFSRF